MFWYVCNKWGCVVKGKLANPDSPGRMDMAVKLVVCVHAFFIGRNLHFQVTVCHIVLLKIIVID